MLSQFMVTNYGMVISNATQASVVIKMNRIFFFYIYTMFIPSLCVVICAELTLFVNEVGRAARAFKFQTGFQMNIPFRTISMPMSQFH